MPESTQKAVTLEALQAAAPLIATKEEVKKQIEAAALGSVVFATTEEVLALFQEAATPDTPTE